VKRLLAIAVLALAGLPAAAGAATFTYSNSTPIALSDGAGSPYPSSISVSELTGKVTKVTVTLSTISHPVPDDIDALLVGPGGGDVMVLSDACGAAAVSLTLTFDGAASNAPPNAGPCPSGTYRPVNYGSEDGLPAPAPGSPYGDALGDFKGINPNGTWSLFAQDDDAGVSGSITGGWRLALSTSTARRGVRCGRKRATVIGTAGNDQIEGTRKRDVIAARAGRDTIDGLRGRDIVCGGKGRDFLFGGKGRDRLAGQGGKDELFGGAKADRLKGGKRADLLVGGKGNDRCTGGPGRDRFESC
jgi:hypothetical protein